MKESVRKNPANLLITVGVVLVHILVIGLILWGCNSSSGGGQKGKEGRSSGGAETAKGQSGNGGTSADPGSRDFSASPGGGKTSAPANAQIDFGAKNWSGTGIIVDMQSNRVLWEKDSRNAVPIASMTKLMTALLVAEELERNPKFTLDTKLKFTKSAEAAIPKQEGKGALKSNIPLAVGDEITVHDLLRATLMRSANDAANLLAENLGGGSVDAFIAKMNRRAKELKLDSMTFHSANGLNNWKNGKIQITTGSAADVVRLADLVLKHEILRNIVNKNSATVVVNGKTRIIKSTNPLLRRDKNGKPVVEGAEGMKTGHTLRAGWCLAFSVKRNGRRVIGCVTGFISTAERDKFCKTLIEWAYDPESINRPKNRPAGTGRNGRGGRRRPQGQRRANSGKKAGQSTNNIPEPRRAGTGQRSQGK